MKTTSIVARDDTNTRVHESLVHTGDPIVRNTSDTFVLLEDMPWERMKELADEYCTFHDNMIRELFLAPAEENARANALTRIANSSNPEMMANIKSPYALRIETFDVRKAVPMARYVFVSSAAIREAMIDEGIYSEGAPCRPLHEFDIGRQRAVAERILSEERVRKMSWAKASARFDLVASERIRELVAESSSTPEFLERVTSPLLAWMRSSHSKNKRGNKAKKLVTPSRRHILARKLGSQR